MVTDVHGHRRSIVTDELYHEADEQHGDDPAIKARNDVTTSFYEALSLNKD